MKLIVDCDPGIDDLLALAAIKAYPNVELLGITTVAGNQVIDKVYQNAKDINTFFNLNTKVYQGSCKPLVRDQVIAPEVHGDSGICSICLPTCNDNNDTDAISFLYEQSISHKGKLDILAIGPLTNIAQAIRIYPDFITNLNSLTIMGGSHKFGNITPSAEFNIFADPHAASIVFNSGIKVNVIGLDATMDDGFNMDEINELCHNIKSKQGLVIQQALEDICKLNELFNLDKAYIHDLIAFLYLVDNDITTMCEQRIDIELYGNITMGKCIVDFENKSLKPKNALFALSLNKEKFSQHIQNIIDYYEQV